MFNFLQGNSEYMSRHREDGSKIQDNRAVTVSAACVAAPSTQLKLISRESVSLTVLDSSHRRLHSVSKSSLKMIFSVGFSVLMRRGVMMTYINSIM